MAQALAVVAVVVARTERALVQAALATMGRREAVARVAAPTAPCATDDGKG